MKLYFIVKNDWQWNFGLEVWSSGINEKEKFILSIRFANLMVFLSYLTVSRILHITYAKVMNFSLYKTRGIVPEYEIYCTVFKGKESAFPFDKPVRSRWQADCRSGRCPLYRSWQSFWSGCSVWALIEVSRPAPGWKRKSHSHSRQRRWCRRSGRRFQRPRQLTQTQHRHGHAHRCCSW